MRVAFINSDWNSEYRKKHNKMGGVGYYRMWLPKLAIEETTDWKVDFIGSEFPSMIDATNEDTILKSYVKFFNQYDLVMLKHFDNPNAGRFIVAASDITGVPFISDLDDDILSVREDQPAFKKGYGKGGVQQTVVATMLSFSKGLIVTNDYLGQNITKTIKDMSDIELPYWVIPNYNNQEEWSKYKSKTNKNKIVIGWHGSLTHNADLEMVMPTLRQILLENKNVYLEFMGGVSADYVQKLFKDFELSLLNRIKIMGGTLAWHNFPYKLMKLKWDIGIAPLIDDKFNRSKSNIKWLEYSMKHIPTVASNVEPYRSITEGIDGFLCTTKDDWYNALTKLIKSKTLRTKIGEKAHKEITKNWQYQKAGKQYKKVIESVLKSK